MKNKIIDGYLKKFIEENGTFSSTQEEIIFEHLINYLIIKKEYIDDFEIDDIHTGGGNDLGIDGIAIFINDFLADSEETAKYLINEQFKNKDIKVDFVFIQTKTSGTFNTGEILTFFNGIKEFFEPEGQKYNNKILNFIEAQNFIFENSSKFATNPTLTLFYVTLGKYDYPEDIEAIKRKVINDFENMSLFDKINIKFFDTKQIINLYKDVELRISKEIDIQRITTFPTADEVKEAFLAIVPIKSYLQLITDENSEIIRSLFYDNVRDYQGDNPVNTEIIKTINSNKQKYFGYLNNGITIVAKDLNKVGDKLHIKDFQVVNGCQTSTIIYNNQSKIKDEAFISIKLISTDNNDIINMIIRATNRQTEVKPEAFESLSEFHKNLEEFYNMIELSEKDKIYYERRNKQYVQQNIPKYKVITLAAQIKAYISMFKEQPHSTHRYYGELLKNLKIFQKDDNLFPYFISSFTLYKVEELFRKNILDTKKYRKYKFHIILLLRENIAGEYKLYPNSKKNEEYCQKLLTFILSDKFNDECQKICKHIDATKLRIFPSYDDTKLQRLKDFTYAILKKPKKLTSKTYHRKGLRIVKKASECKNT